MNKQIINKVAEYLKTLSVSENYNRGIPFKKGYGIELFSNNDRQLFIGLTNFERNILLKTLISEKINTAYESKDIIQLKNIFEWIVHDWGGIKNGRGNIDKLYEMSVKAICENNLNFDRIASTSKILSFYKPNEHIIYDSRIAYSLNAIMLLEDATDKYFPVPSGTNSKMNAFNIEVLIRLKHKSGKYKRKENTKLIANADKTLFVSKKEAYSMMKKTIIEINQNIYNNEPEKKDCPFYTEMLLFGIADTLIYDRIYETIKLEIKQKPN